MKLWTEGNRKAIYGTAAFAAVVAQAFYVKADFGTFATHIEVWLGLMLAAHVTAEKLGKAKAAQ